MRALSDFPRIGRFAVLDVETAPAPELMALSGGGHRGNGRDASAALHVAVAATVLLFTHREDGAFDDLRLVSLNAGDRSEAEVLLELHDLLAPVHSGGGGLITFNGLGWDLPFLERRAARHWQFGRLAFADWGGSRGGASRHLDLMRSGPGAPQVSGGRWSSLVDSCAAFGIDASVARLPIDVVASSVAKCEVDVVSTYLLHLYALSMADGSAAPVAQGWTALARHLVVPGPGRRHLRGFARHPNVEVARRLLAEPRA